jgi:plasmid stabilization system protein ParE
MKRIVWSREASKDISRLRSFIHEKNPDAAGRAVKTIRGGVKLLETLPEIGQPLEGLRWEYREKLVPFGAGVYTLRYRIAGDRVVILAIRHGLEDDFKN